jgi:hypothetical protein
MSSDINDKLAQFLKEDQNWEKEPTNIQGVFLLKLPASKQSPSSIAIEVNPHKCCFWFSYCYIKEKRNNNQRWLS